jgi:hypothetical protein
VLVIELAGVIAPGATYQLRVDSQPLVTPDRVTIEVQAPSGGPVAGGRSDWSDGKDHLVQVPVR